MPKFSDSSGGAVSVKLYDVVALIKPIVERNLKEMFVDVFVEVAKEKAPPPPKNTASGEEYRNTGNNAASIEAEGDGLRWTIATHSNYGGYLEFGTKKMRARPYFSVAAVEAKRNIESSSDRDWQ